MLRTGHVARGADFGGATVVERTAAASDLERRLRVGSVSVVDAMLDAGLNVALDVPVAIRDGEGFAVRRLRCSHPGDLECKSIGTRSESTSIGGTKRYRVPLASVSLMILQPLLWSRR